jgi:uncharacterized repeat protein (TIGR02059 family)
MASFTIRRGWFNWPTFAKTGKPQMVNVNKVVGANVTIQFDEPLRAAPVATQFTATVNGVARVVNAAVTAGSKLTITLASAVANGQRVVITYVKNGTPAQNLADVGGTAADNFVVTITA